MIQLHIDVKQLLNTINDTASIPIFADASFATASFCYHLGILEVIPWRFKWEIFFHAITIIISFLIAAEATAKVFLL